MTGSGLTRDARYMTTRAGDGGQTAQTNSFTCAAHVCDMSHILLPVYILVA